MEKIWSKEERQVGLFDTLKKKQLTEEDSCIYSPVDGEAVTLESLQDGMFSEKIMGDGIAVIPSSGEFRVPVSGTMVSVFPTGHAYGIKTASGKEVLVHIGLDTVEMKGEGFQPHVKQGQKVNQGDKMVSVDLQAVKRAGYSAVTSIVVTSQNTIKERASANSLVKACDKLLELE